MDNTGSEREREKLAIEMTINYFITLGSVGWITNLTII